MFDRPAKELIIHLTKFCPLECNHCNVRANKYQKESIELQQLIKLIQDAKMVGLTTISFAGGEPFSKPDLLIRACEESSALGLKTKAITSAFWATKPSASIKFLSKFKKAGLQEIIFSYDDSHAVYLKEHILVNAVSAALALDIKVTIQVAVEPNSVIDKVYIQNLLKKSCNGSGAITISQALINSTGRAEDLADEKRKKSRCQDDRAYKGPCSSVLTQVSVHTNGAVVPCCGVIPEIDSMKTGNVGREPLKKILDNSKNDALYRWIALEGSVSLLCQVTENDERAFTEDDFDGICDACNKLFTSPKNLERARQMSIRKKSSFDLQEEIYNALNWPH